MTTPKLKLNYVLIQVLSTKEVIIDIEDIGLEPMMIRLRKEFVEQLWVTPEGGYMIAASANWNFISEYILSDVMQATRLLSGCLSTIFSKLVAHIFA